MAGKSGSRAGKNANTSKSIERRWLKRRCQMKSVPNKSFLPPTALEALAPQPLLLPGESLEEYLKLREAIYGEIAPTCAIEWLLAIDIAELSWEIQRYRLLRHRLLERTRQRAIANALAQIDLVGISTDDLDDARRQIELNAFAWRSDAIAAAEIANRLASHGVDHFAINTDIHVQTRELYLTFEGLIVSAQHRRIMLLREINNRRHAVRTNWRHTPNGVYAA